MGIVGGLGGIVQEQSLGNGGVKDQPQSIVLLRQACVARKRGEFAGAQGERGVEAVRG
jgi:hypothetical protein